MSSDGIYIVIPAYNADQTIGPLIQGISQFIPARQVIVVDDGSGDNTVAAATKHGVRLVQHARNRGKGSALMTGFREAMKREDCDAVITMDADLQHHPDDLPGFMEQRRAMGVNLVLGVRQKHGTGMPLARQFSNTVTSFLVSWRIGSRIPDSQCGYRLIGNEVLRHIELDSSGYEAETEFILKAARKGFTMGFVPVRTVYAGERSHMTHWETTRRFIHVLFREV